MPETPHHVEETVNPETHHETTDVNVRALIWFAVIFVVFAFVAHFTLSLLFHTFVKVERHRNTNQMTDIRQPPDVPKNQPLLQPFPRLAANKIVPPYRATPVIDLGDLRAAEDRALHSYGWVDRQKGIVHVPIDVAMRLTLQRGLPVQQQLPPTPPNPGAHP